jgi:predicted DNA-binding transcriptional regulator AlpA
MTNYLRFKQLQQQYVPVAKVTGFNWVRDGKFPPPLQLNPGVVNSPIVWPEDEILAWLATRPRGFGPCHAELMEAHRRKAMRRNGGPTPIYGFRRGN